MTAMLAQSAAVHRPGTAPHAWQLTFLGLWAYLKYTCRCAPPNKPMKRSAPFVDKEVIEL